ncbi:hypothetical protein AV530_007450 [Patagioenas fasciata monilis]|uniref:Uncharacterized protein n=1 Tax=Patagioenas fasciata monilis TaxID=372326 RepID=A0A1V4JZF3_PATFA|nr:hypothetical protein AV530_007450 [Patagioenas fasciata monilis]
MGYPTLLHVLRQILFEGTQCVWYPRTLVPGRAGFRSVCSQVKDWFGHDTLPWVPPPNHGIFTLLHQQYDLHKVQNKSVWSSQQPAWVAPRPHVLLPAWAQTPGISNHMAAETRRWDSFGG